MAKQKTRPDLEIQLNEHIPDGKRAEDGRTDVSPGPQRKHDTPAYHGQARSLHLRNAEPEEPLGPDDLGVASGPGTTPIEGADSDPNNPNNKKSSK